MNILIYALILLALAYFWYRYKNRERVNNLTVVHSGSKLARFFKMITDHFLEVYADGLLYPGHAQTFWLEFLDVFLQFFRDRLNIFKFKFYKRELLKLKDGGSLYIDHAKSVEENVRNGNNKNSRILVVFPGYTSRSDEYYINNLLNDFVNEFECIVVNSRGFGGKLTTPHLMSPHCYKDVREYLEHVCKNNPNKKVFAVGFSYGGMLLARCLGTDPETLPKNLYGGCGICYPICIESTKNHVEGQLRGFYSKYASKNIRKLFFENIDVIFDEDSPYSLMSEKEEIIEKMKTLKRVSDFDEIYTYKMLNFKTPEEYYEDSVLTNYLPNIKIPFLSVFSKDDPIIPFESVPLKQMQKNPNLVTIVSNKGGHLGFFTGLIPQRWIDIPIKTFIKTVEILHEAEDDTLLCNEKMQMDTYSGLLQFQSDNISMN